MLNDPAHPIWPIIRSGMWAIALVVWLVFGTEGWDVQHILLVIGAVGALLTGGELPFLSQFKPKKENPAEKPDE